LITCTLGEIVRGRERGRNSVRVRERQNERDGQVKR